MIPLKDDNPTKNKTHIRSLILILCSIVFFIQLSLENSNYFTYYFGFKPKSFFLGSDLPFLLPTFTLITSIFMHGGWMHFLGNMLYLWIFADNVEDKMGSKKFILFYILSGVVASLSHGLLDINSNIPLIGASGAIAGVLGAYLHLFPKAKVLVLVPFFIFFTIRVPAFILLIFWFLFQFLNLGNQESNVAWVAHIGGFVFGLLYSYIFNNKIKKTITKKGKSVFLKRGPWD